MFILPEYKNLLNFYNHFKTSVRSNKIYYPIYIHKKIQKGRIRADKKGVFIKTQTLEKISSEYRAKCEIKKPIINNRFYCGLDGTRTRDPLRDRQVF